MAEAAEATLRFLHILFGIMWVGGLLFSVGVVARTFQRLGMETRKEVTRHFVPIVTHYMPMSAILTIVFGAILYLVMGDFDTFILFGTGWGLTLLTALVLTLGMFAYGMLYVVRSAKRMVTHFEEENCTHGAEVGGLVRGFARAQVILAIVGVVVIGLMVVASRRLV